MKVNAKYFDLLNTAPIEVQNCENGTVSIYSLNDFPQLHSTHVAKGKFYVWSNKGGSDYKLAIDNDYYEVMKDLYSAEVNNHWFGFYDKVELAKKNTLLKVFLPVSIVVMVLLCIFTFAIPESATSIKPYLSIGLIIAVFVVSRVLNKRISDDFNISKNESIEAIRTTLGAQRFEELLDAQEQFTKDFYKKQYVDTYGEDGYDLEEETPTDLEENLIEENTEDSKGE